MIKKGEKQVVETKSDAHKIKELREQIKELERVIGQKQLKIDFQEKMIELAEQTYDVDIKKKLSSRLFFGSGQTGQDTPGK
jgi:hypothetical protein